MAGGRHGGRCLTIDRAQLGSQLQAHPYFTITVSRFPHSGLQVTETETLVQSFRLAQGRGGFQIATGVAGLAGECQRLQN